jgi:hypothetical protein
MNMMQRFDKTFSGISEHFPETMEIIKDFYAKEFLSLRERVEGMPDTFPEKESDEYDAGFKAAKTAVLRIIDEI